MDGYGKSCITHVYDSLIHAFQTLNVPWVSQSKDGTSVSEYMDEEVQDNVYQAILKQAYLMYRLFSGTYEKTVETDDVAVLKNRLEHFYTAVRNHFFMIFIYRRSKTNVIY